MALPTHWNPFRQMARADQFPDFDDLVRSLGLRPFARQYEDTLEMRMNLEEEDGSYLVSIDMPGVRKEDIDISIEGRQVNVSATVKQEQKRERALQLYSERFNGTAFRSFGLPTEVDSTKAVAHYDGGVLHLTLPKKADTATRKLSVN